MVSSVFTTILQNAKWELSERARIHSLGHSLGRKLLFVFPLTNAQLDLTKRKMYSNGSANVKHSDEIITAMSTACGASINYIFLIFDLFKKKKKTRKHLLS